MDLLNMDTIVGTCKQMCPEAEIIMREKERLLHPLEMLENTRKDKVPKANKQKMVKQYTRSAAGINMKELKNLRPYEVLIDTVQYLLYEVISNENFSWIIKYNFICDRLRSVRQDMIIQDISKVKSITLLQPMVRFHAFAAYKLCEENINNFDPTLNNKHLQECLKRLLVMYDECEFFMDRCKANNLKYVNYEPIYQDARSTIESIYILHNLGDVSAIERALKLPKKWQTLEVWKSLRISLCFRSGNWVRMCKLIKDLPHILAAIASLHLPEIRKKCFQVMSTAFNSKTLKYSVDNLKECLLYSNEDHLIDDLKVCGINDIENGQIRFSKTFCATKVMPRHESFVEEKFRFTSVPNILVCDSLIDELCS